MEEGDYAELQLLQQEVPTVIEDQQEVTMGSSPTAAGGPSPAEGDNLIQLGEDEEPEEGDFTQATTTGATGILTPAGSEAGTRPEGIVPFPEARQGTQVTANPNNCEQMKNWINEAIQHVRSPIIAEARLEAEQQRRMLIRQINEEVPATLHQALQEGIAQGLAEKEKKDCAEARS